MKKLPIALQLYSIRDCLGDNLEGYLKQVRQMGYDGVELGGMHDIPADVWRKALDEAGLVAISSHVAIDRFNEDLSGTVQELLTLGCKYAAIPWMDENRRPGHPGYEKVKQDILRAANACKEKGIQLLYHNHDFEFEVVDGIFGLDKLYQDVDASLLQTQLDTCWINVAGQSPVAYIEKYAGRCPIVHLKDFYMDRANKPAAMYALMGVDDTPSTAATNPRDTFEFRPLGMGLQDFPAILDAAGRSGAKWVVVEQDESTGRSSMEAAAISIGYLKQLGL
nr:sugar phosphate isomerase/epimerase [bacterium]